jgi:uncharacterized protein YbjT (DUF2867 family)
VSRILVTGATGTLGTPTTARLRDAGLDVRALSRKAGPDFTTGDLLTGEGIPEAIAGVDTVVHLATGVRDVDQAKAAIGAARAADVEHFVLISIVGIEDIPLGYYQGKVAIEKALTASGIPHTILRATQFHQFVDGMFRHQKYSPVILAPRFSSPVHRPRRRREMSIWPASSTWRSVIPTPRDTGSSLRRACP